MKRIVALSISFAAACAHCETESAREPAFTPRGPETLDTHAPAVVTVPPMPPRRPAAVPIAELAWASPIESIAVRPDGSAIAAGTASGFFVAELPSSAIRRFAEGEWTVALDWTPDGGSVRATDGWYGADTVGVYEVRTGAMSDFALPLGGARPWVVAWTEDGATVVAYDNRGLFASVGGSVVQATERHAEPVARIAVARTTAASADGREIFLWELPGLTRRAAIPWAERPTTLALSRDGSRLVAGARSGAVLVADTREGAAIATLSHPERVASVAFSPDVTKLATACDDGSARIFSLAERAPALERALAHPASVQAIAFSPDGALLATGADDGFVRTFDVATGSVRAEIRGP